MRSRVWRNCSSLSVMPCACTPNCFAAAIMNSPQPEPMSSSLMPGAMSSLRSMCSTFWRCACSSESPSLRKYAQE